MLERLQLTGFQKHRRLRIQFGPHVTTIVGPNDAGKSAVIRALQWLATARIGSRYGVPGTGIVHWDTDTVDVRARIDGHDVRRTRGPKENTYTLDGERYMAVKTDVPPPVAALLNMSEINFQLQHDQYYWFSLSGGQISKELNAVIDLGIMDRTLGELGRRVRTASSKKEVCEERHAAALAHRATLAYIPTLIGDFEAIETLEKMACGARGTQVALGRVLQTLGQHTEMVRRNATCANLGGRILALGQKAVDRRAACGPLAKTIQSLEEATQGAAQKVPDTTTLVKLEGMAKEARRRVSAIATSIEKFTRAHNKKLEEVKALEVAKNKLSEYAGGVCPVCTKPLTA